MEKLSERAGVQDSHAETKAKVIALNERLNGEDLDTQTKENLKKEARDLLETLPQGVRERLIEKIICVNIDLAVKGVQARAE